MNPLVEQTVNFYKEMPLARKILMGVVAVSMLAGFAAMFVWANKTEYKLVYSGLTEEDAAAVVERLKASNIPYRLEAGGTTVLVPEDQVYDVRLTMARDGIPKGSGVGFEIFDKTDFGTTEFVQKINRRRAIQGELARTIRAFDEVKDARVMIVFPKDSVFVEETKKPSASILLELKSDLTEEKVAAVAHLVASAIEDLTPKLVTIVDTTGRILFEGKSEEEKSRIDARNLADSQYKYKIRYETTLSERIQTMLERIVGKDKAIVRVTAEMDFSTSSTNEEIYDPFERETTFVRSRQNLAETGLTRLDPGIPSSVNPVVPPGDANDGAIQSIDKKNDTVNYEVSRRTSQTVKPMAVVQRVSVAAVVDGKYELKTDDTGNRSRAYVPRSQAEMAQFNDIVVKAMGFNENRQDQVSMECFPFASIDEIGVIEPEFTGWRAVQKEYGRTIANVLLVILLFLLVVRPIVKTVQGIQSSADRDALPGSGGIDIVEDGTDSDSFSFVDMAPEQQREFLDGMDKEAREAYIESMSPAERAAYIESINVSEKAGYYARRDVVKATNIIRGWLNESPEEDS
ncbi:MAG: flagellar basal-body MS-ring/collar protein FliF [Desulfobacterium sp.]|jgi:flagellar M-ring protein FliF|nr:flagellar basal-body MS-ring/collar protein FliF [Desulfobacterium sp.]